MNKTIQILKYLIGWPLSAVSLLFVGKLIIDNAKSLNNLTNINLFLLSLGIGCFVVYFFLRTYLWHMLIKPAGNKLTYLNTSYLWEISEIKRYTPGNIWSFLSRARLFSEKNVTKKDVAGSMVNEVILIVLSSITLSYFYLSSRFNNAAITMLFVVLNIVIFLLYILNSKFKIKFISQHAPRENFKYYAVAIAAFFCFGLATYFSAVSIVFLDPKDILNLISLFVFALLVGYLSIVTPMGLGVREGVTTLGLSSQTSISNAGLISIFTRIIFIVSEVIFLGIVFLFNKIRNDIFFKIKVFLSIHKFEVLLLVSCLLFIVYFTVAGFLRYENYNTGRFDLGNMDQAVWNTIHGRIFQVTDPNGTSEISRLAFHADFILVLLAPLYLIWSNPKMLILIQVLIVALGAIFTYLLGIHLTKNKLFSLILSICFMLYPATQYALLYDFHPVVLSITFLLATFYCFIKKKYLFFLFFAILSGLTKEEVWSIIAIFGLVIAFRSFYKQKHLLIREFVFGAVVFLSSGFIFYELIWRIIPLVRGSEHFALTYFSDFGTTPSGIFLSVFLNPLKTLMNIYKNGSINYLFQIFFPLGFVSIFSLPILIFASPDILINTLSNNVQLHQIYYQYSSTITPFIFISAIFGVRFLIKRFKFISYGNIAVYLIFMTLISQYYLGPMPGSKKPNIDMFIKQLSYSTEIDNFLNDIPTRYSIAATNNLGSHLSRRRNIFTIPLGIDKADVILFLLNDQFAQPSLKTQKDMAKQMEKDRRYELVYKLNDFIVFEKRGLYAEASRPKKGQVNLFPYSITALINREYTKSDILIERKIPANGNFKSYIISFNSDGLKEYALMNIPNKEKPANGFPVLILNHGYINPTTYDTINSYKSDSDYFANQGFLIIKPDYRGNGNSEVNNTSLMRFAYPIDVLNLISSVPNIKEANSNQIFLWSHSMGGEVTLEVLEVANKHDELGSRIKGAVFWAPVTDAKAWFSRSHLPSLVEAKLTPFPYAKTFQTIGTPEQNPQLWQSLSPLNYLSNISIPILLQHGTADTTVPYSWSVDLNNDLQRLHKQVTFISYPDDTHNLPIHWFRAVTDDTNFFNSLQK
jgi:uncharacterized membrane protein/pimeloyl-ACP methyl ester carboxylesterase